MSIHLPTKPVKISFSLDPYLNDLPPKLVDSMVEFRVSENFSCAGIFTAGPRVTTVSTYDVSWLRTHSHKYLRNLVST